MFLKLFDAGNVVCHRLMIPSVLCSAKIIQVHDSSGMIGLISPSRVRWTSWMDSEPWDRASVGGRLNLIEMTYSRDPLPSIRKFPDSSCRSIGNVERWV